MSAVPRLPPPGSFNAHWFALFNAVGFQIMMGAPIILYANSLGASSTVLGIIAAFTPIMTIFQLPAARFLDRIGYRDFVLMGWGLRTVFIFFIAAIPLLSFLDSLSSLAVLMACLFCFNLLRGISTAAWMPWITALIAPSIRGKFLSLDQMFTHIGCLLALVISALVMSGEVRSWEFSVVFAISGVSGVCSLIFIRRIPDIPLGEVTKKSAQSVPWKAILAYPPFRALLVFNLSFMIVVGSLGVFTIEYLREIPQFGSDTILLLSACSFLGALSSLPLLGGVIDRIGSRPVLIAGVALLGGVIGGWFLLAAAVLPASLAVVATLNFFSGIAGSSFHLANVRMAMLTMPEMGRNHFFALFTVITSLGLGAAPVLWGVSLDAIGTYEEVTGWFTWRRHSFYFLGILLCNVVALVLAMRLRETGQGKEAEPGVVYASLKHAQRKWFR